MKNTLFFYIVVFILFGIDGFSDELKPPIPSKEIPCSEEIQYIFNTDQSDRLVYILDTVNFDVHIFNKRDSIRLSRLMELDNDSCIKDYQTAYDAAFVYLHDGGIYMLNDSSYFKRSSELFQLAAEISKTKAEKIKANELKSLSYNYYLRTIKSDTAKPYLFGTITDFNVLIDDSKIDSLKNRMRESIKNKLSNMGISMSESDIEKTVNNSMEYLKKSIVNQIISIKNRYEKQFKENKKK